MARQIGVVETMTDFGKETSPVVEKDGMTYTIIDGVRYPVARSRYGNWETIGYHYYGSKKRSNKHHIKRRSVSHKKSRKSATRKRRSW